MVIGDKHIASGVDGIMMSSSSLGKAALLRHGTNVNKETALTILELLDSVSLINTE